MGSGHFTEVHVVRGLSFLSEGPSEPIRTGPGGTSCVCRRVGRGDSVCGRCDGTRSETGGYGGVDETTPVWMSVRWL